MNEYNWDSVVSRKLAESPRTVSGDILLHQLLDIEGVDLQAPKDKTASELDQFSIYLFRVRLAEEDPRWRLVYKALRLKSSGYLVGAHLEHALRADYLSEHPSIRRGNSRYIDEITIPQLARALANIEIGNNEKPKFFLKEEIQDSDIWWYNYEAGRIGTHSIPDARGITGCQEGLWQLQLFQRLGKADTFLGRIGFNFHLENNRKIVSVTNIQGGRHTSEQNAVFTNINGYGFGEFLIHTLRQNLGNGFILRGVAGRTDNVSLYRTIFKYTNVQEYEVNRLTEKPYSQTLDQIFHDVSL